MSDGFAYLDILFFAMVAAFIAYRLRSVLGQRTGHERRPVTRDALLTQALKASSNAKRIMWLRREADAIDAAATPFSACSSGCSHCCHIGVMMLATAPCVAASA